MTCSFTIRMLALVLAVLVSACGSTRGGDIPYNASGFGAPDAPQIVAADEVYRLAPLDTIGVKVFGVPELTADYTVDQSGVVTLPLLGRVPAVSLTTWELAQNIEAGLGEKYLRSPNVTVALKESRSRVVTVDGAVRQPGIYPIVTGSMTLLQAVASAQGATDLANERRVAIFRTIDGRQVASAFDLISIRRGENSNPQVYPGDTIVVDGSGLRQAQRELLQALPVASTLFFVL